jgi:hypothetical protein
MFEMVLSDKPLPQVIINTLYNYYEQPNNKMTVGELYLLLKLIVSKLEDELEQMGMLQEVNQTII